MIDFKHIEKYKENNRIEAKKSLGGLPKSIWETYSAFANTYGGIILLGVIELTDKTFKTVNLPEPERLLKEFWEIIEDKEKVSSNILSKKEAVIHEIDGDRIIAITVPRADRRCKPVYIGNNPYLGTYRRDGEGDYHCTKEEVDMMLRDKEERSVDAGLLEEYAMDVFDYETVRRYRTYLCDCSTDYDWDQYSDEDMLLRIGACGRDFTGRKHPTVAGLLLFGFEDEIVKSFPYFFLDYQEQEEDGSIVERIISNSGKWSGNLFDFYLRISGKIIRRLPYDIHKSIREAVANCMMNSDYFGNSGLLIIKRKEEILIMNPGNFRIDIVEAIGGGKSDPRNGMIAAILNLVKIGTRSGKGVPDMYKVWEEKGWKLPSLEESFKEGSITLRLPLYEAMSQKSEEVIEKQKYIEKIIDFVTRYINIQKREAEEFLEVEEEVAERILEEMEAEGILVSERQDIYHLKI